MMSGSWQNLNTARHKRSTTAASAACGSSFLAHKELKNLTFLEREDPNHVRPLSINGMASTRSLNVNLVGARCRNGELLNAIHHGHLVGAILRITVALRRPIPALSPTIGERHHNLAIRLQIHRRKAIPALVLDPIAATSAVAIDVVDARVVEAKLPCDPRIKVAGGLVRAAEVCCSKSFNSHRSSPLRSPGDVRLRRSCRRLRCCAFPPHTSRHSHPHRCTPQIR